MDGTSFISYLFKEKKMNNDRNLSQVYNSDTTESFQRDKSKLLNKKNH